MALSAERAYCLVAIYFRVGFKPPATIGQAQDTVDFTGKQGILEAKGRHDPCVVPRAIPIVSLHQNSLTGGYMLTSDRSKL